MNKVRTRLYRIWNNMKQRCYNPNNTVYAWYGGKGITICDEWKQSFDTFAAWAHSHGYTDELTLDRIDSSAGYFPENCRWASRKEQANNKSNNRLITWNNKTQTAMQWAEELGIDHRTLWARLQRMPVDQAMSLDVHHEFGRRTLTFRGETHSVWEWSRIMNIPPTTLSARLNKSNWSVEKALTTPVKGRA